MALGKFDCRGCGYSEERFYKGRGTEAAASMSCPDCGDALRYRFQAPAVRMGFEAGVYYGTGCDNGSGTYFGSRAAMDEAMRKAGTVRV